jgi:DNA (cytosine-5)-methyltransferase 1
MVDIRYLPKTDVLWASPICTEVSPAGGTSKQQREHRLWEEDGHVSLAAFDRTRITFWEVIRACEVHNYQAVMVENVPRVASAWALFDVWLLGMETLGYQYQFVSVSSAHVGDDLNPHAPQWRDRLYIVFTKVGVPLPDLEPRPLAWCGKCDTVVSSLQAWKKPGRHIGRYGPQYNYVCQECKEIVEPFVAPASGAIDWTDLGRRIGDRAKPLSPATMKRIEYGLEMFGEPSLIAGAGNTWDAASGAKNSYYRVWPSDSSPVPSVVSVGQIGISTPGKFVVGVNHEGSDGRSFDPSEYPLPSRLAKNGEAVVGTPAFVTMLRRNTRPTGVDEPLYTFTTAHHHGLTIPPFLIKQFGGRLETRDAVKSVQEPMGTTVAAGAPGLVIPYRKGSRAHTPDQPISTVATHEAHGLAQGGLRAEDCYFRMLTARESANAQAFPTDYIIMGNKGEQQIQAGNAVSVNVAHWLGRQVAEALA